MYFHCYDRKHLQDLDKGLRMFDDFLREGSVEFLDVNEENNALIALEVANIVPYA